MDQEKICHAFIVKKIGSEVPCHRISDADICNSVSRCFYDPNALLCIAEGTVPHCKMYLHQVGHDSKHCYENEFCISANV